MREHVNFENMAKDFLEYMDRERAKAWREGWAASSGYTYRIARWSRQVPHIHPEPNIPNNPYDQEDE